MGLDLRKREKEGGCRGEKGAKVDELFAILVLPSVSFFKRVLQHWASLLEYYNSNDLLVRWPVKENQAHERTILPLHHRVDLNTLGYPH
jgi:hypothetical protein